MTDDLTTRKADAFDAIETEEVRVERNGYEWLVYRPSSRMGYSGHDLLALIEEAMR